LRIREWMHLLAFGRRLTPQSHCRSLRLNALYYIERSIMQPLARIFNLLGADVERWFKEMPRIRPIPSGRLNFDEEPQKVQRLTLAEHYRLEHCVVCGQPTDKSA